jgi:hypothetical protein
MLNGEVCLDPGLGGTGNSICCLAGPKRGHGGSAAEEGNPRWANFVQHCFMAATSCCGQCPYASDREVEARRDEQCLEDYCEHRSGASEQDDPAMTTAGPTAWRLRRPSAVMSRCARPGDRCRRPDEDRRTFRVSVLWRSSFMSVLGAPLSMAGCTGPASAEGPRPADLVPYPRGV